MQSQACAVWVQVLGEQPAKACCTSRVQLAAKLNQDLQGGALCSTHLSSCQGEQRFACQQISGCSPSHIRLTKAPFCFVQASDKAGT